MILFLLLTGGGCSHDTSAPVGKERFTDLYAKAELINQSYRHDTDSSAGVKRLKLDSLFAREGVTRDQFTATVAFYQSRPALWTDILHGASQKLESLRTVQGRTR